MLHKLRGLLDRSILGAHRLYFLILFKRKPGRGEYCNSKRIRLYDSPVWPAKHRPYLAVIRCGSSHSLIDDGSSRNFDLALNRYAKPDTAHKADWEYLYVGGVNKYKAAFQFIGESHLANYRGFVFLDDDVEMTYSDLSSFLTFCSTHGFGLAQPSLTPDSIVSHRHLINVSNRGWRSVPLVEVMCPYFSASALREALPTFDLSYSTWGLDFVWPRLFAFSPVVVDEFRAKHVRALGRSGFYQYMRRIGVSPQQELEKLKNSAVRRLGAESVGVL